MFQCSLLRQKLTQTNKFKENVDYAFLEAEHQPGKIFIQLLTGEFRSVIYSYERVRITEDPITGTAKLAFHYNIEKYPSRFFDDDDLNGNHVFVTTLGDILKCILSSRSSIIGSSQDGNKHPNNNPKATSA